MKPRLAIFHCAVDISNVIEHAIVVLTGQKENVWEGKVVFCTGGCSRMQRESTCSPFTSGKMCVGPLKDIGERLEFLDET
jgi:hypothetical protein